MTLSHLPAARLLAESFLEHHPEGEVLVVIVDADKDGAPPVELDRMRTMTPHELGFDEEEIQVRAAIYEPLELCCSFRASALRAALDTGVSSVLYLDSDIEVYAGLHDVFEAAATHGIVLSPHTIVPYPDDGLWPDHQGIVRAGTFNSGLVGVGPQSGSFLGWWDGLLARYSLQDEDQGLVSDQRWLALVPALFECHVLRDPTVNVAYWNLHAAPIEWGVDGATVAGRPLRCFHFSGFDPAQPDRLSRWDGGRPRLGPGVAPAVARLCRRYAARVTQNGWGQELPKYRFGTSEDGIALDIRLRRRWRVERMAFEQDQGPAPPNPFVPSSGFAEWASPAVKAAFPPHREPVAPPHREPVAPAAPASTEPPSVFDEVPLPSAHENIDLLPLEAGSPKGHGLLAGSIRRVLMWVLRHQPFDEFAKMAATVRRLEEAYGPLARGYAKTASKAEMIAVAAAELQAATDELRAATESAACSADRAREIAEAAHTQSAVTASILEDVERRLDREIRGLRE